MSTGPRPIQIKVHKKSRELELVYQDASHRLSHEFLRVHSPSADVRGHGRGQGVLQHGKRDVSILDVVPVGHYAVQLVFSDGHDTGIYSWAYFYKLCCERDSLWADYLKRLEAAGKTRSATEIARG